MSANQQPILLFREGILKGITNNSKSASEILSNFNEQDISLMCDSVRPSERGYSFRTLNPKTTVDVESLNVLTLEEYDRMCTIAG